MSIDYEMEFNNRARVPGADGFIKGWADDAAAFRESRPKAEYALRYGPRPRNTLDLFLPEGPPRGAALYLHGGWWQLLDGSYFSHLARGLLAHGLAVGIATYTLCPEVPIREIVSEAGEAASALARRTGFAPVLVGHSAGGHLAASLLCEGAEGAHDARAALAIAGIYDLVPVMGTSLNTALGLDAPEAAAISPLFRRPRPGTTLIATVGEKESDEFRRQTRLIAGVWAAHGIAAQHREEPGRHHFDVVLPLAEPDSGLTREVARLALA